MPWCDHWRLIVHRFRVAQCECQVGWRGQHCQEDINGCIINSCTASQVCIDVIPVLEQTGGTAYSCEDLEPCLRGYERGQYD